MDNPGGVADGPTEARAPDDLAATQTGRLIAVRLEFPVGIVRIPIATQVVLGRAECPEAPWLGRYNLISRRHARLMVDNSSLIVFDEHSTNGTYRNGVRLLPGAETRFDDGDEFRFGTAILAGTVVEERAE